MSEKIINHLDRLKDYCEKESFKGYDPYDGLNSTLFKSIPWISKSRFIRLIWIQAFKRSPINLRPLVGISKDYNPKALGLFLSGYCKLYIQASNEDYLKKIIFFSQKLIDLKNCEWSGACWGYNFDWQSRAFYLPKNSPTVVVTAFISNSLLDAYEITGEAKLLTTARSACDFILKDLQRNYDPDGNLAFSYSPFDKSIVFNASLWGSQLLARVYSFTKEKELIEPAKKSVAFCCSHQKSDGSWGYGTYDFHQWVDNFHTGYNLECISDYMRYTGDITFEINISKGFEFYINNFFTKDGIPKYYNNSMYPIDIHAPAQLVMTLSKLSKLEQHKELVDMVFNWTFENMRSKNGYFYYQINKYFSSKISYMRWAQAWMFYSMAAYLLHFYEREINGKAV
jgi:rhamnogalacturonyl hydrolase YesR